MIISIFAITSYLSHFCKYITKKYLIYLILLV